MLAKLFVLVSREEKITFAEHDISEPKISLFKYINVTEHNTHDSNISYLFQVFVSLCTEYVKTLALSGDFGGIEVQ